MHMKISFEGYGCTQNMGETRLYQEAMEGFQRFRREHPRHYAVPQAVLGEARCLEQLGRPAEARVLYEDFIAENIAAPLGLDSTLYGGSKLIPNRASGYSTNDDGNIVNASFLSMTQPHAAGSLLSTTGDLAEWHKILTGGEFIHDESYELMTTPYELNDGETYPYGYGLGIGKLRDRERPEYTTELHNLTREQVERIRAEQEKVS